MLLTKGTTEESRPFFALPNKRVGKVSNEDALALIISRAEMVENGRHPMLMTLHRQWFMNNCYFLGLQAHQPSEFLANLDPAVFLSADNNDYVANHIYRVVLGQVSRLSNARPDVDVIPKSPDMDDQEGARVGQFFLDHYEDVFNMRAVRRQLATWNTICGTSFVRTDFNPRAGDKILSFRDPFSGQTVAMENLNPEEQEFLKQVSGGVDESKSGEIELEVLSPFQVIVPPDYPDERDMPWMLIQHFRSLDWCWDQFGDKAAEIETEEFVAAHEHSYLRKLHTLINRYGFTISGRQGYASESVVIYELWIPPSARLPKGLHVIATKKRVLLNEPHPYAAVGLKRRFPIRKFTYCDMPGRYWGISLVEQLIGPQLEYNRARSQVIAQRDILATPQWLAPIGSELVSRRNEYGDFWEYNSRNGKPELQNPPSLSTFHMDTIERALLDMQTISAQSEASQAQVPEGVRSGVAIRALQEKDLAVIGPTIENLEDGFKAVYEGLLELTWKFVTTEKSIRMYGESRQADIAVFKGSQLNGNVFVRIRPGSMMPKSKAETMQVLIDLQTAGVLNAAMNPKHAKLILQALEIGGIDNFFLEEALDRRRADLENQMFLRPQIDPMTGEPQPFPAVNDHDDDAVHIERHTIFKKTDAYELLPPARKMALDAHIMFHEQKLAALVQANLALSAPAGGGGGSPPRETGKPSPPAQKNPTKQAEQVA